MSLSGKKDIKLSKLLGTKPGEERSKTSSVEQRVADKYVRSSYDLREKGRSEIRVSESCVCKVTTIGLEDADSNRHHVARKKYN